MTQTSTFPETDMFDGMTSFGSLRKLERADVLFTLGDTGSEMFLIEKGSVDLFFDPGKKPKRLEAGELFGELAFIIGDHQRTATAVVAEDDTEIRVFGQQTLKLLVNNMPNELFKLFRHTCSYLVESEQNLIRELNQTNRELEYSMDHILRIRQELTCYRGAGLLDQRTGLLTRHCITLFLDKAHAEDQASASPYTLMLIRVHDQDAIRQMMGPKFEEMILPWLVEQLRDFIGPDDLIFHEEHRTIGLLLLGATREDAESIPRALLRAVEAQSFPMVDESVTVRISIGASVYQRSMPPMDFIARVNQALDLATQRDENIVIWL